MRFLNLVQNDRGWAVQNDSVAVRMTWGGSLHSHAQRGNEVAVRGNEWGGVSSSKHGLLTITDSESSSE